MAIYGQPNPWQCGPFALKHALLTLGRFAHEDELAELAESCVSGGTDERGLGRAAGAHGCELGLVRRTRRDAARRALTQSLDAGVPVLLCLDQWEHWVSVVGHQGDRFVVFDSHFPQPLRIEPWAVLGPRLVYREQRWFRSRSLYDLHPLAPRSAHSPRMTLTPGRAVRLLTEGDGWLGHDWDELARRVVGLGTPSGSQLEFGLGLAEWIAAHRNRLARAATERCGVGELVLHHVLSEIGFVASLYDLTLRPEDESRAEEIVVAVAAARATRLARRRSLRRIPSPRDSKATGPDRDLDLAHASPSSDGHGDPGPRDALAR